jgi:hypothetical protein
MAVYDIDRIWEYLLHDYPQLATYKNPDSNERTRREWLRRSLDRDFGSNRYRQQYKRFVKSQTKQGGGRPGSPQDPYVDVYWVRAVDINPSIEPYKAQLLPYLYAGYVATNISKWERIQARDAWFEETGVDMFRSGVLDWAGDDSA